MPICTLPPEGSVRSRSGAKGRQGMGVRIFDRNEHRKVDEPTPKIHASIVGSVAIGAHLNVAAGAAGVDAATLRRWLNEGRRTPDGPCGRLRRDVRAAEARFVRDAAESIRRAAKRDKGAPPWLGESAEVHAALVRDIPDQAE